MVKLKNKRKETYDYTVGVATKKGEEVKISVENLLNLKIDGLKILLINEFDNVFVPLL